MTRLQLVLAKAAMSAALLAASSSVQPNRAKA
jgi:hypothetical protein